MRMLWVIPVTLIQLVVGTIFLLLLGLGNTVARLRARWSSSVIHFPHGKTK